MEHTTELVQVQLPNGAAVHLEATVAEGEEDEADVLFRPPSFEDLLAAVEGMAGALASALEKIRPRKASIEFGVEANLQSGLLTAVIVQGTGKANLKITLEWGQ